MDVLPMIVDGIVPRNRSEVVLVAPRKDDLAVEAVPYFRSTTSLMGALDEDDDDDWTEDSRQEEDYKRRASNNNGRASPSSPPPPPDRRNKSWSSSGSTRSSIWKFKKLWKSRRSVTPLKRNMAFHQDDDEEEDVKYTSPYRAFAASYASFFSSCGNSYWACHAYPHTNYDDNDDEDTPRRHELHWENRVCHACDIQMEEDENQDEHSAMDLRVW